MCGSLRKETVPFQGGNTGSNPVGDTKPEFGGKKHPNSWKNEELTGARTSPFTICKPSFEPHPGEDVGYYRHGESIRSQRRRPEP